MGLSISDAEPRRASGAALAATAFRGQVRGTLFLGRGRHENGFVASSVLLKRSEGTPSLSDGGP